MDTPDLLLGQDPDRLATQHDLPHSTIASHTLLHTGLHSSTRRVLPGASAQATEGRRSRSEALGGWPHLGSWHPRRVPPLETQDHPDPLQLIHMVDQHGRPVALNVRQDGRPPGLVRPGRRARFKIRAEALMYRVERVVLGDCEDWHIHDVCVGGRSQLTNKGNSPEEDGFPGAALSPDAVDCFLSFETTQTAMDFVLDVSYVGPAPDGAALACSLTVHAVYGDGRDDLGARVSEEDPRRAFAREIAGRVDWEGLRALKHIASQEQQVDSLTFPPDRTLTIPPHGGAEVHFYRAAHGIAINAILVQLPDDVAPYFAIDKIQVGDQELPMLLSAGSLFDLTRDVVGDVVVTVWNTGDEPRDFRAVLWMRHKGGYLVGEAMGWEGDLGLREFAAWLGGARPGTARQSSPS